MKVIIISTFFVCMGLFTAGEGRAVSVTLSCPDHKKIRYVGKLKLEGKSSPVMVDGTKAPLNLTFSGAANTVQGIQLINFKPSTMVPGNDPDTLECYYTYRSRTGLLSFTLNTTYAGKLKNCHVQNQDDTFATCDLERAH